MSGLLLPGTAVVIITLDFTQGVAPVDCLNVYLVTGDFRSFSENDYSESERMMSYKMYSMQPIDPIGNGTMWQTTSVHRSKRSDRETYLTMFSDYGRYVNMVSGPE